MVTSNSPLIRYALWLKLNLPAIQAMRKRLNKASWRAASRLSLWATVAISLLLSGGGVASSQQVWLAAVDPYARSARHWNASVDYMDLFRANAPWAMVAHRTAVFKLGPSFSRSGDADQLKQIIDNLRQRNIALAIEIGLLPFPGPCSKADEAHTRRDDLERLLARIRSLGGSPRYIAMDEPVTYGRRPLPDGTCSESIADIAKELSPSVALLKSYFPSVEIGDIEVVDLSAELANDVVAFTSEFQHATGVPLAFQHMDVSWSHGALQNLVVIAKQDKSKSIPFGVIYNGPPDGDVDWTAGAQRHVAEVEAELGLRPDDAVFQTWMPYPTHLLPETQPGTLTNVVLGYLRARSRLTIERAGARVSGQIFDDRGPIANAGITLAAQDVHGLSPLQLKQIKGVVPAGAKSAVIGVRIDAEGVCACAGDVDVRIGKIEYQDGGMLQQIVLPDATGDVREFRTNRGKPVVVNSRPFPVATGADFTVTIPASATEQSESEGYVAVIFLSADGKGIDRQMWYFRSNEMPIGRVTSDSSGRYGDAIPLDIARLGASLIARYAGDSQRRDALARLP